MLLLGTRVLTLTDLFPATNIHLKKMYRKYLTEDVVVLFK